VLARRAGTELFGVYNYVALLVTYGFTFVEFGLKNYALREIAQGRGSTNLVKKILTVRCLLAATGVLAVVGLSYLAFPSGNYLPFAFYFGLTLFVDAFLVDYIVIAQERLAVQAFANISQAAFVYLGTYFFVKDPSQFNLFAQIMLLSHFLWIAIFYFAARAQWTLKPFSETEVSVWGAAKLGLPFLVAQFLYGMQATTDLLFLGQFHFTERLGNYAAAIKVISVPQGVFFALLATLYPRFARYSQDLKSAPLRELLNSSTRLIWVFNIPMLIGIFLFGDQIIQWFFGSAYKDSFTILKPLSISMALFFLGLPPMVAILVSHKPKLMIRVTALNLAVSALCALVPLLMGVPDWLPWAMIPAEGFFLATLWSQFKNYSLFSMEEIKTLWLPTLLMTVPLLTLTHPVPKFAGAALGYSVGILGTKLWHRPWVQVFQESVASQ
jgi:O-antigen/teichoic acid export membrane protein